MDRESLFIPGGDPNRSVSDAAETPESILIRKLREENQDLRKKLRAAREMLIKLDKKLKASKAPPPPCSVCGNRAVRADDQEEAEKILQTAEDNLRVSRASRRPPPASASASPPAIPARIAAGATSPRRQVPKPATSTSSSPSSPLASASKWPWRAMFLLWEYVPPKQRSSLALVSREWSRAAAQYRRHAQGSLLALSFYTEEREYRNVLSACLTYRKALEAQQGCCTEQELQNLFSNSEMLWRLASMLVRDLNERMRDWAPGDGVADAFLTVAQSVRVYGTYYANFELVLPKTLVACRAKNGFDSLLLNTKLRQGLPDLAVCLKAPLHRIESYRVLGQLLLHEAQPGTPEHKTLTLASDALLEGVRMMNEALSSREAALSLQAALSSIKDLPPLRSNMQVGEIVLLKDSELVKIARRQRNMRVVLLNTRVVMALQTKSGEWKCDQVEDVASMFGVKKVGSQNGMFVFSFSTPDKTLSFGAATEALCDEWTQALNSLVKGELPAATNTPKKKSAFALKFGTLSKGTGARTTK